MVRSDRRGAVLVVTLDRPERRNAVDIQACRDLADVVGGADGDGARVIVLTGAEGNFCAGADLGDVEDVAFVESLRLALGALRDTRLAAIASIEGAALGAGTQLAIACDLRVASPDARLGIPAAKLGLMVDHWTVQRLSLMAGHGPARAMLLAAETLSGDDAVRLGLAQRTGTLDDAVAWAEQIARLAPLTIAGHKLSLGRVERTIAPDPELDEAFARAWRSADLAEGMAAFRERRPPEFSGE